MQAWQGKLLASQGALSYGFTSQGAHIELGWYSRLAPPADMKAQASFDKRAWGYTC